MSIDVLAAAAESVLKQLKAPDHYDEHFPDLETMAGEFEQLAKRLRRYANNGLPRMKSETLEVEALCKGLLLSWESHTNPLEGRPPRREAPSLQLVANS